MQSHGSLAPLAGNVLLLALLVLLASLRFLPSLHWQGRDDGIYAYDGLVVARGGIPYRDTWENKPPGIFYADALALVLWGENRWSLWILETGVILAAALIAWALLGRVFERGASAAAGTAIFVLLARHPDLAADANFTETYALLPQIACFALGYVWLRRPTAGRAFALGLAAAAVFLFKISAVGVALMLIPALALDRHPLLTAPGRGRWLAAVIAGGLLPLGAVLIFLAAHGILREAFDAVIIFPGVLHRWVSREPASFPETVWRTLTQSIVVPVVGPLLPLLLPALRRAIRPAPGEDRARVTLARWALLTFLFDLAAANLTNRMYRHYYITLVPSLALLLALGVDALTRRRLPRALRAVVWIYLALGVGLRPVQETLLRLDEENWRLDGPAQVNPLSRYVAEHTRPGDSVLVWGASSAINFQARRLSPTQYHYSYPLMIPGWTRPAQITELVRDLERARPPLILDNSLAGEWAAPLNPTQHTAWRADPHNWRPIPDLAPVYAFVAWHCTAGEVLYRTTIYHCRY